MHQMGAPWHLSFADSRGLTEALAANIEAGIRI